MLALRFPDLYTLHSLTGALSPLPTGVRSESLTCADNKTPWFFMRAGSLGSSSWWWSYKISHAYPYGYFLFFSLNATSSFLSQRPKENSYQLLAWHQCQSQEPHRAKFHIYPIIPQSVRKKGKLLLAVGSHPHSLNGKDTFTFSCILLLYWATKS